VARGIPKYSLIADQLERDIGKGRYPVGSLLPTENALMTAYDVGRHTVRNAVQTLRARGIVASRQGQGSKVVADGAKTAYVEAIQSFDELLAFGKETRRELIGFELIEADQALADKFRCAVGRRLLQIKMNRRTVDDPSQPIAVLTLWMDALFEPAIDAFESQQRAVADILAEQFGCDTGVVVQTVAAGAVPAEAAETLGVDAGDPALVIEREYAADADSSPHLLVLSICAAETAKIVSRFTASDLAR